MCKNSLNNFNLIYEQKEIEYIFESKNGLLSYFSKKWSFQDEFEALLPFIFNKVKLGFKNMCDNNEPGELIINGDPEIIPFDEGTEHPGFQVSYIINDNYTKQHLIPALLKSKNSPFIEIDKSYNFSKIKGDLNFQLVIRLSAYSNDLDLTKPNLYIRKFSIKEWSGAVYLNLNIKNINRKYSNVQIGTIRTTIEVSEYKPLLNRISEKLTKKDVQKDGLIDSIGNIISNIFGDSNKKNDANWDKIKAHGFGHGKLSYGVPGAEIKCVVNFDKDLKPKITLNSSFNNLNLNSNFNLNSSNNFKYIDTIINTKIIKQHIPLSLFYKNILLFNKTSKYELDNNFKNDDSWTKAKKDGKFYKSIEKQVDDSTDIVCGYVYSEFLLNTVDWQKFYKIFIDITDWKQNSYDNKYLIEKNSNPIFINVNIYDEKSTIIFSRWYTKNNFKLAEPEAYNYILSCIEKMKPLN